MPAFARFRRSRANGTPLPDRGHMTWASKTIGSRVSQTGQYLKRRLWIWPLIAVLLHAVIGYFVHSSIEATMKENLAAELQTLLRVETAMLENWLQAQESNAESMANNREVRAIAGRLLGETEAIEKTLGSLSGDAGRPPVSDSLVDLAQLRDELAARLSPAMSSHDYEGFVLIDRQGRFAGTPLYMSPEAIQMPGSVDAATDLYAVGAVSPTSRSPADRCSKRNRSRRCARNMSPTAPCRLRS